MFLRSCSTWNKYRRPCNRESSGRSGKFMLARLFRQQAYGFSKPQAMSEPSLDCPEVLKAASRVAWCHSSPIGPACDRLPKRHQLRSSETRRRQSRPNGYSFPPVIRRPYFDKLDHLDSEGQSSGCLLADCKKPAAGTMVSNATRGH
jgi:hypothetical protein